MKAKIDDVINDVSMNSLRKLWNKLEVVISINKI